MQHRLILIQGYNNLYVCMYVCMYVDIKECSEGNGGCDQECIELDGGFQCNCSEGYVLTYDLRTCSGTVYYPGHTYIHMLYPILSYCMIL